MYPSPQQVGVEIFLRKQDMILLGKRKNCYGAGDWGLPGGHLEAKEKSVDTAIRELKEETGLVASPADLLLIAIVDDIRVDQHYLHISFEMKVEDIEPILMEPDKCEEWKWFSLGALPDNIFIGHRRIVESYLSNKIYLS